MFKKLFGNVLEKVVVILLLSSSLTLISCETATPTSESPASSNENTIVSPVPSPVETIISSHNTSPTTIPTLVWTPEFRRLKSSLLGDPCAAPCWFGIEPGVTTQDEVISTLNRLQEDGLIQRFYLTNSSVYFILFVDGFGARAGIEENSGIVESLVFGLESPGKLLTLGDVIEYYGEPVLVRRAPGSSYEGIRLIYPDQQMELWVQNDSLGANQQITDDLTVRSYGYYTPELIDVGLSSGASWVGWEGYQTFLYYYQRTQD